MSNEFLLAAILLLPLSGFVFNGLTYCNQKILLPAIVGTGVLGASFVVALLLVLRLGGLPVEERVISAIFFEWISVGALQIPAKFTLDQISAVMILVITGVGTLIHLFSSGYMSHDERPSKFFAYLNLFIFNMLILVLGDNLPIMFVGWEGVGLCSYLLIGFWFKDPEKAHAGMKAFVTNRIGDAGLVLGMFILFRELGTLEFAALNAGAPETPEAGFGMLTIACLLLFVGAMGKSAQIPLYVWLPDAMAGPTPVSALIHAATMVTAGIYMIVRLNVVFMAAPMALGFVAIVGAVTAIFAAIIGFAQNDIKKILAYSTVSQLGYMFIGVGVGAFGPAMFHLMTHAFFKALMFLGAGSVIHGMHEEQDITKMGGLSRHMPVTYFTFLMGWLAIIGMPPFSGFFSKDEILWQAFSSPLGHWSIWLVGLVGAAGTAFYMTRLMCLTFWGKERFDKKKIHPHESPTSMTLPLIILALLSAFGGWIGIPEAIGHGLHLHLPNLFQAWLAPRIVAVAITHEPNLLLEWIFMGLSVSVAGLSGWLAYFFYIKDPQAHKNVVSKLNLLLPLVRNKFYVDEFYEKTMINPLVHFSKKLWLRVDSGLIDRVTYLLSDLVNDGGRGLREIQSGNLQQYLFYMILGVVALLSLI